VFVLYKQIHEFANGEIRPQSFYLELKEESKQWKAERPKTKHSGRLEK
jgi:hypothetical protein